MIRVRPPFGNAVVLVTEARASQLEPQGWSRVHNPDGSWRVAELKEYAAVHNIDLGDATKKSDILAVLTSE
jgi:hypothetical protein